MKQTSTASQRLPIEASSEGVFGCTSVTGHERHSATALPIAPRQKAAHPPETKREESEVRKDCGRPTRLRFRPNSFLCVDMCFPYMPCSAARRISMFSSPFAATVEGSWWESSCLLSQVHCKGQ